MFLIPAVVAFALLPLRADVLNFDPIPPSGHAIQSGTMTIPDSQIIDQSAVDPPAVTTTSGMVSVAPEPSMTVLVVCAFFSIMVGLRFTARR